MVAIAIFKLVTLAMNQTITKCNKLSPPDDKYGAGLSETNAFQRLRNYYGIFLVIKFDKRRNGTVLKKIYSHTLI